MGFASLAVLITFSVLLLGSCTSHAQPLPKWATAVLVNAASSFSMEPKSRFTALRKSPSGTDLPLGAMQFQKKEWFQIYLSEPFTIRT